MTLRLRSESPPPVASSCDSHSAAPLQSLRRLAGPRARAVAAAARRRRGRGGLGSGTGWPGGTALLPPVAEVASFPAPEARKLLPTDRSPHKRGSVNSVIGSAKLALQQSGLLHLTADTASVSKVGVLGSSDIDRHIISELADRAGQAGVFLTKLICPGCATLGRQFTQELTLGVGMGSGLAVAPIGWWPGWGPALALTPMGAGLTGLQARAAASRKGKQGAQPRCTGQQRVGGSPHPQAGARICHRGVGSPATRKASRRRGTQPTHRTGDQASCKRQHPAQGGHPQEGSSPAAQASGSRPSGPPPFNISAFQQAPSSHAWATAGGRAAQGWRSW